MASTAPEGDVGAPRSSPLTSALLAAVVVVMVVGCFGSNPLRSLLAGAALDPGWDVFAPDPMQVDVELIATITFADGTQATWEPPQAAGAAAVTTYHWEGWERAVAAGHPAASAATARWLAERFRARAPVQVVLTRRWHVVLPPGSLGGRPSAESAFFVHDVAGR